MNSKEKPEMEAVSARKYVAYIFPLKYDLKEVRT